MSKQQLFTVIADAVFSIAAIVIGFWVAPEFRDVALAIVAVLQGLAAALIAYFAVERKIAALRAEVRSLTGRR
jgi:hypothetical protein